MIWLMILLGVVVLVFIIVVTKVNILVSYRHNQDDDLLEVKVRVWKLQVYKFSAPMIKIDEDSAAIIVEDDQKMGNMETKNKEKFTVERIKRDIEKINDLFKHVVGLHKVIRQFLKKTNVHYLEWYSHIGVGDAAHTAQLSGVIWTLKGSFIGLMGNYMRLLKMPILRLTPHFQSVVSKTSISCMISFGIGHAIIAGLMLLKHWKRRPRFNTSHSVEKNM